MTKSNGKETILQQIIRANTSDLLWQSIKEILSNADQSQLIQETGVNRQNAKGLTPKILDNFLEKLKPFIDEKEQTIFGVIKVEDYKSVMSGQISIFVPAVLGSVYNTEKNPEKLTIAAFLPRCPIPKDMSFSQILFAFRNLFLDSAPQEAQDSSRQVSGVTSDVMNILTKANPEFNQDSPLWEAIKNKVTNIVKNNNLLSFPHGAVNFEFIANNLDHFDENGVPDDSIKGKLLAHQLDICKYAIVLASSFYRESSELTGIRNELNVMPFFAPAALLEKLASPTQEEMDLVSGFQILFPIDYSIFKFLYDRALRNPIQLIAETEIGGSQNLLENLKNILSELKFLNFTDSKDFDTKKTPNCYFLNEEQKNKFLLFLQEKREEILSDIPKAFAKAALQKSFYVGSEESLKSRAVDLSKMLSAITALAVEEDEKQNLRRKIVDALAEEFIELASQKVTSDKQQEQKKISKILKTIIELVKKEERQELVEKIAVGLNEKRLLKKPTKAKTTKQPQTPRDRSGSERRLEQRGASKSLASVVPEDFYTEDGEQEDLASHFLAAISNGEVLADDFITEGKKVQDALAAASFVNGGLDILFQEILSEKVKLVDLDKNANWLIIKSKKDPEHIKKILKHIILKGSVPGIFGSNEAKGLNAQDLLSEVFSSEKKGFSNPFATKSVALKFLKKACDELLPERDKASFFAKAFEGTKCDLEDDPLITMDVKYEKKITSSGGFGFYSLNNTIPKMVKFLLDQSKKGDKGNFSTNVKNTFTWNFFKETKNHEFKSSAFIILFSCAYNECLRNGDSIETAEEKVKSAISDGLSDHSSSKEQGSIRLLKSFVREVMKGKEGFLVAKENVDGKDVIDANTIFEYYKRRKFVPGILEEYMPQSVRSSVPSSSTHRGSSSPNPLSANRETGASIRS